MCYKFYDLDAFALGIEDCLVAFFKKGIILNIPISAKITGRQSELVNYLTLENLLISK